MTDTFGHRLSGSPALEATLQWASAEMSKDFDQVHLDPVMVPHWVRGAESLAIVQPRPHTVAMLGLGGSIATPPEGIEAEVMVVRTFAELDTNAARARGRIVLFNAPYTTYAETVAYRSNAASRAAVHGAVAALVRAVGPPGLRTPHTGSLYYTPGLRAIPAAAIATEDADRLQRMQDRGDRIVLRLRMEAATLPDAQSANLVADYRGRERPEEIVAIGCHIDSWDVGTGATDDGGACIVMWEAVRVLKRLNLRPRRTIRVVFWTNEENGAGVRHRRLPPRGVRVLRSGARPRTRDRDRIAARRHRRQPDQFERRRRRHRAERGCRQHSGDVARGGRLEVLRHPPHARRHGGQDRTGRNRELRGGGRGHGLRGGGHAASAGPVGHCDL
jgi:Iap family predicted aminopeptidase